MHRRAAKKGLGGRAVFCPSKTGGCGSTRGSTELDLIKASHSGVDGVCRESIDDGGERRREGVKPLLCYCLQYLVRLFL